MKVTITCEECKHSMVLERHIYEPGPIALVCHDCETPIVAEMAPDVLDGRQISKLKSLLKGIVE